MSLDTLNDYDAWQEFAGEFAVKYIGKHAQACPAHVRDRRQADDPGVNHICTKSMSSVEWWKNCLLWDDQLVHSPILIAAVR